MTLPIFSTFTFICVLWQYILELFRDFKVISIRQIYRRIKFNIRHDRCVKIQNRFQELILSSSPPSSTRNVDVVGLANMSGDLFGKKSQLDLKPFGVGVPIVGSKSMPWLIAHRGKKDILVERKCVSLQHVKRDAWGGSNTWRGKKVCPLEAYNSTQPERNTRAGRHHKMETRIVNNWKWRVKPITCFNNIHTIMYGIVHTWMCK